MSFLLTQSYILGHGDKAHMVAGISSPSGGLAGWQGGRALGLEPGDLGSAAALSFPGRVTLGKSPNFLEPGLPSACKMTITHLPSQGCEKEPTRMDANTISNKFSW